MIMRPNIFGRGMDTILILTQEDLYKMLLLKKTLSCVLQKDQSYATSNICKNIEIG